MHFEDIKKIADTYGYNSQSRMLIEEMAELTKAINKAWRNQVYCKSGDELNRYAEALQQCRKDVVEEIADVEIMLAQIKYLMRCSAEVIEVKEQKISRQLERIKESEQK